MVTRLSVSTATLLLTVVLLSLTFGCAKKSVPSKDPGAVEAEEAEEATLVFEANISAIDIFDDRTGTAVEGRKLHMPEWTIVGQEDEFAPVLNDGQRDLIGEEVKRYFVPGERTISVDIYVLKGKQAFKVGEQKESIVMTFALRVEMSDRDDVHDVRTGEGSATATEEALDITYEQVDELYDRTIRESIRKALGRIRSNR